MLTEVINDDSDSTEVSEDEGKSSSAAHLIFTTSPEIPLKSGDFFSAIELKAMLEKGLKKEFLKSINVPRNLVETDDLTVLTSPTSVTMEKCLCRNLFNLLCCLAGEGLTDETMNSKSRLLNFDLQFKFWYNNVHTTQEHMSGFFRLFPDRKLPQVFVSYIDSLKVNPTEKWVKSNKLEGKSVEELKCFKFGSIVKTAYDNCKKEVNGFANPLYIPRESLPSGLSEYAFFYFMRKQLWPARAQELATA